MYDTFAYNGMDMYENFLLRVIKYDVLTPPLRSRKLTVPERSGAYNFGAKYHDERMLHMECMIDGYLEPNKFDDMKYLLSREGQIVMWDETDRYYGGQIYDAQQVQDLHMHCGREFNLDFICEPYKKGETHTLYAENGLFNVSYRGTRETPVRIQITNNTGAEIGPLTLIQRYKA